MNTGTEALLTLLEELQEMSPDEFMELYNEISVKVAERNYIEKVVDVDVDTEYREFQDWSDRGYKIKKGSKATEIGGVKVFHVSQVEKYDNGGRISNCRYKEDIPF